MLDNGKTAATARRKPSEKYEGLTTLEGALLDLQSESNDRLVTALERLESKVPSPRLIFSAAGSLIVGVGIVIVYIVSLIAQQRGVDLDAAAGATDVVMGAASGGDTDG